MLCRIAAAATQVEPAGPVPVGAAMGRVRKGVVEDVEGALTVADVDAEALAGSCVSNGDREPSVGLAPEQPDLDSVRPTAVELVY